MTNSDNTVPIWFWVVAGLAVAWNAIGAMAFYADVSQTPEQLAQHSQAIQDLYASRPGWAFAAFAVAVIAGLLGSIGLLLRKNWAVTMFWASLIAVIVQNFYSFGIAKMHTHVEGSVLLPAVVALVAIALLFFSRSCRAKSWLS